MHVIIWEFQPKSGSEKEFERAYGANGEWVRFFKRGEGYLGTDLLRFEDGRRTYLTIDRWESKNAYETFRNEWRSEYEALDRQHESLMERETLLGLFVGVNKEWV